MHNGGAVEGGALDLLGTSRQQRLEDTRRRLGELCTHLASGSLAAGPQFGRLLSLQGEPTAECTPRWNSLRSRLQERDRKRHAEGEATARGDRGGAEVVGVRSHERSKRSTRITAGRGLVG